MKKILTSQPKRIVVAFFALSFSFFFSFCLAGGPLRGDSSQKAKPTVATPQTAVTTPTAFKTLSKAQLTEIVDSLLNLDSIDVKEIELISYYGKILGSTKDETGMHTLSTEMPATGYYDDFDYATIFHVTPPDSFPDQQLLVIQGDSMGTYFHPRNDKINSPYGWRPRDNHHGMDIDLNKGDPVVAAFDGMVRIAKKHSAFGNMVLIRHYNGLETVYGHMSKLKVKAGQHVLSGQLIGLGGSTGRSTGPHLHFEVRFKGQPINPANFIDFKNYKINCDTLLIKRTKTGIVAYPKNATFHTVTKGDSWYEIAKRYGLMVKELLALNGTEKKFYLRAGQKIRIN